MYQKNLKTLYKLLWKLKNSPKNIKNFQKILKTIKIFQKILSMKTQYHYFLQSFHTKIQIFHESFWKLFSHNASNPCQQASKFPFSFNLLTLIKKPANFISVTFIKLLMIKKKYIAHFSPFSNYLPTCIFALHKNQLKQQT